MRKCYLWCNFQVQSLSWAYCLCSNVMLKRFFCIKSQFDVIQWWVFLKMKLRSRSVFVIHLQLLIGNPFFNFLNRPWQFHPSVQESQELSAPTECFAQQELKGGLNYMCLSWGDTSGVTPISGDFRTTTPACLTSIDYSAQHFKSQQKWRRALHHHCRSEAGVHISPNSSSSFKHTASWGGNRTRPTLGC